MSLEWEGFIDDARSGNVGGTFEYFDTEAQPIIIRNTDDALISTYDSVDLGQWFDSVWENNLRVGNFGLSQFVPRHLYNGEIWAVGITPTLVPAETGQFPTPEVPAGFYIYRYSYWKDLTELLVKLDTNEQSDNLIKDAGVEIWNQDEGLINKTSSIFSGGSKVVARLGMGDSSKMYVSTVYVDEVSWSKSDETMKLAGRNAIGYYLSEQTFDDQRTFTGDRKSVLEDILEYSGVNLTKLFIDPSGIGVPSAPVFDSQETLLAGIVKILDVWGWRMMEMPNGWVVIGTPTYLQGFCSPAIFEFVKDQVFARDISVNMDGVYSRLALQSQISATDTAPAFTRTVYKALSYYDGWNVGNRKTLYIQTLDDQSEADMNTLIDEYAKAYQYIGATFTLDIPIRTEMQAGDVIQITDAETDDYLQQGIVTGVSHTVDAKGGSARTTVSINTGGTILDESGVITTYTAADVTGDTRRRELIDVIRKAIKKEAAKKKTVSAGGSTVIDGGEL